MNKQITIKIIACGLVAVTLFGFGACKKKDKEKETTTTTTTTKSAWVDESITSASETTTEATTAPTQPEAPVVATQATEGKTKAPVKEKTTKASQPTPTPNPSPAPNPQPTPTPTPTPQPDPTPEPAPPAPAELTQQMKDDMVAELMNYARSIGYTNVYSNPMESYGNCSIDVTPEKYNSIIEYGKSYLELCYNMYGARMVNVKWSTEKPNKIFIMCDKS